MVCGYYVCGGVKLAMQSEDLGILNPWLRNIRDVYRLHKNTLNNIENEQEQTTNRLTKCTGTMHQYFKISVEQKAFSEKSITVHGWVCNVKTGVLKDLQINFDAILKEIIEIYHIK